MTLLKGGAGLGDDPLQIERGGVGTAHPFERVGQEPSNRRYPRRIPGCAKLDSLRRDRLNAAGCILPSSPQALDPRMKQIERSRLPFLLQFPASARFLKETLGSAPIAGNGRPEAAGNERRGGPVTAPGVRRQRNDTLAHDG